MKYLSTNPNAFNNFRLNAEVVWCFIEQAHAVLIVRKAKQEDGVNKWGVPGGKIEPGLDLSPLAGVAREVWEETGIRLQQNGKCHLIGQRYARYKAWDYRLFVFKSELASRPTVVLSQEHDNFQWVPLHRFKDYRLLEGQAEAFDLVYPLQDRALDR